jgi:hypothetical protein
VICLDSRRVFIVLNAYRAPVVADNWTLREIALFEAAMCAFGKDFHAVQQAVSLKSIRPDQHVSRRSLQSLTRIAHDLLFRPSLMQVKTKTTNDIVDFYYMWKKSTHYMIWKSSGKPSEPPTEPAEDRAKVVAAKMRGFA